MSTVTTWTSLLITGLRGNAKTLKAVGMMARFVKDGVPVFASNFNELTLPGVVLFDDPREWMTLPKGAVLFVDEAQEYWRTRAGQAALPENVKAMERQRHLGIRIVMLTQQPTYIDKHVRTLFDTHIHLVRRAGLPASQQYEWERCKDEPESTANIEIADKSVYTFETQYYGTYKSADEHYIRRKLPTRLKVMVAAAVLAVSLGWWAVGSLRAKAADAPAETASESVVSSPRSPRKEAPRTRSELIAAMQPRIPGALWSAPIYDEVNEVQPAPKLVCMIGSRCRCKTTQGTDYRMPEPQCRAIVRNGGIVNPYLDERDRSDRGAGGPPAAMAAVAAVPSPVGVGEPGQLQAAYGSFRAEPATVPPADGF